jgi:hypothetical protein
MLFLWLTLYCADFITIIFFYTKIFYMRTFILQVAVLIILGSLSLTAQEKTLTIAERYYQNQAELQQLEKSPLMNLDRGSTLRNFQLDDEIKGGLFYKIDERGMSDLLDNRPDLLVIELTLDEETTVTIQLTKAQVFTEDFKLFIASDKDNPVAYDPGVHYWGLVNGMPNSLAALSITGEEVMGIFQYEDQSYTLGKLNNSPGFHVLYKNEDLLLDLSFSCDTDSDEHFRGEREGEENNDRNANPDNCVRMYVEVDYDIFVGKGGTTQAANYVSGAFSQVAILYANENINFVVNEMLVWDIVDPYTGPSTSNYLTQFRNYVGTSYNGDLAHLVGYNGGGGVAYLDVVCNRSYGFGYSAINSSYANVPTYSWTVMVLAHEIGHNLGSPHTHDCRWNGNNTPIDCCGQNAGYAGSGCASGYNCTIPDPSEGGTIMSYCHLRPVRINLNLGFGPQPGNLMRNRVYNGPCLTTCGPAIEFDAGISAILQPIGFPCEASVNPVVVLENYGATTLTSVTIEYQLNSQAVSTYNWSGSLASGASTNVSLPLINYNAGTYTFMARTSQPNGNNDEVPGNDEASVSFTYIEGYCDCNEATANFNQSELNHSGSGSSSTSINFLPGSKNLNFTISNLTARINGNQNNRYIDQVTISYTNGNNNQVNYGTFSGNNVSSVNVVIDDFVNSVTISLQNGLNNNFSGNQSVSLSEINYCSPEEPCSDEDGDGVCDEDDVCPGFNDNLIGTACDDGDPCTFNDVYTSNCICEGTPDPNCGQDDCDNVAFANFSVNPLTQSGATPTNSSVNLPTGSTDVDFTISNLAARLNGNPNGRYIDRVTVTYVNGNNQQQSYGVFTGDVQNSVNVNIPGEVQSVNVALDDAYDGNSSPNVLSVSFSSVEYCATAAPLVNPGQKDNDIHTAILYPNPANTEFTIELSQTAQQCEVIINNSVGQLIGKYKFENQHIMKIDLNNLNINSQLLFIVINADDRESIIQPLIIADR